MHESSLWRRSLDGLRVVAVDRTLRQSMLLVCAAAGLLLPVSSLLVPLLGRERGFSAGTTGLVVGAVALGTAAVALAVLARGASSRPGIAGPAGLVLSAAAVADLAPPSRPRWRLRSASRSAWASGSSPPTSDR
jgi:hypothetical protein